MDGGKQYEKPKHPRASANVFSALTFWYVCSTAFARSGILYGAITYFSQS